MILLDTDVCISLLKGNRKLIDVFGDSSESMCVSVVTAQELFAAANDSSDPALNRIIAERFLLSVQILHPDLYVLKFAADIHSRLSRKGLAHNYSDILIYSLSKIHKAQLITTDSTRYCFT